LGGCRRRTVTLPNWRVWQLDEFHPIVILFWKWQSGGTQIWFTLWKKCKPDVDESDCHLQNKMTTGWHPIQFTGSHPIVILFCKWQPDDPSKSFWSFQHGYFDNYIFLWRCRKRVWRWRKNLSSLVLLQVQTICFRPFACFIYIPSLCNLKLIFKYFF